MSKKLKVTIRFDGHTFRVPDPKGGEDCAYYTEDERDALNVGRELWKEFQRVAFRIKKVISLTPYPSGLTHV